MCFLLCFHVFFFLGLLPSNNVVEVFNFWTTILSSLLNWWTTILSSKFVKINKANWVFHLMWLLVLLHISLWIFLFVGTVFVLFPHILFVLRCYSAWVLGCLCFQLILVEILEFPIRKKDYRALDFKPFCFHMWPDWISLFQEVLSDQEKSM